MCWGGGGVRWVNNSSSAFIVYGWMNFFQSYMGIGACCLLGGALGERGGGFLFVEL